MNATQNEIETRYLSACLLDIGCLDFWTRSGIGPAAFESTANQLIAETVRQMTEDGLAVDQATLARKLSEKGEIDAVGGLMRLADLCTAVETTSYAKTHWKQIADNWKLRNFKAQSLKLQNLANQGEWDDIKGDVAAICESLTDYNLEAETRTQKEKTQAAIDDTVRILKGLPPLNSNPIYTGIDCVDRWCKPLDTATGDFNCILFAVTSTGKSSLMAGIVGHNVFEGKNALVFLGETTHEVLIRQIAGQRTRCSIDSDELAREPIDRQKRYVLAMKEIMDLPEERLTIYDDDFYIEDIVARSRKCAREYGNIDLVVIDHLHDCEARKEFKDERLKYNYMASKLKPLGKELNCPILTLAQPHRGLKSEGRPPRKSDLKESGSLEDKADRIWALHLPEKDSEGIEQSEYDECPEIHLHQLKFRRGRTTRVALKFEKRYTRFYDPKTER